LIWAAARENGIPTIYTEDFQHGREIDGVRIEKPFRKE
jgi:predicted nucleic acid-binding protein